MTPEEIKELIRKEMAQESRALQPEFVQWIARAAFEAGWRAGGGDPVESHHSEEAKGWRAAWMESAQRDVLVRQGIISGQDRWR